MMAPASGATGGRRGAAAREKAVQLAVAKRAPDDDEIDGAYGRGDRQTDRIMVRPVSSKPAYGS